MQKRYLKKQTNSSFKERVYEVVGRIPKGQTLSYKRVAELTGKPKAWRAVGNILNKNKDKNIPCHRVIKSNGETGGYNKGRKKKISLLKKELVLIKKYPKVL